MTHPLDVYRYLVTLLGVIGMSVNLAVLAILARHHRVTAYAASLAAYAAGGVLWCGATMYGRLSEATAGTGANWRDWTVLPAVTAVTFGAILTIRALGRRAGLQEGGLHD